MEAAKNNILHTLAARYERSRAGRTGQSSQDLLIDYEVLLREAHCAAGESRIVAERDLQDGHAAGLLTIERHRRTNLPLKVRFSAAREAELFRRIGQPAPTERRAALADLFRTAADTPVPDGWTDGWKSACAAWTQSALAGENLPAFTRDDPRELLSLLPRLLAWEHESLRRFASSRLCGDSKRLEVLQAKLVAALSQITDGEISSLEDLGILENARAVILHGPLRLIFPDGCLDLARLAHPIRIDRRDVNRAVLETSATRCLTVENLSVLHELTGKVNDTLLASSGSEGGFAHTAIVEFLQALPDAVACWHCGDTDPKGFEILRDLRERTGREIQSQGMTYDASQIGPSLTTADRKTIARLLESPLLTTEEKAALSTMAEAGHKGVFEQEARPLFARP